MGEGCRERGRDEDLITSRARDSVQELRQYIFYSKKDKDKATVVSKSNAHRVLRSD